MRHRRKGRKLNRNASHRLAMFRNMSVALIQHESIRTTTAKAKELRMHIEPLVTLAKKAALADDGTPAGKIKALHFRRQAIQKLGPTAGCTLFDDEGNPLEGPNATVLRKLFNVIGPRYKTRPGGYTRVVKLAYRRLGDAGETSIIEFVGENDRRAERKTAEVAPAPAPAVKA